ncbi:diacylglycerol kinase [Candidatus Saganbacteria bacterium CG08_land_8_20_14_0_20_45_16]|uniref:Diacylglycerol kinase n=1 Tax=Candidatus Saganbacteria bacterium CG08_land_8_20_14_0_20_45_16 TaxID=2014293 RepID=A0A2H0XYN7_UNCSA|nr:MAG: diacylglycerol kinase [Candidatus Saganbacteria bacterium CG08_land_8_20_14_0_20_45_16]
MPKKLIKSFKYAGLGAEYAWRTQRNLWLHLMAGLGVLALAVWLNFSFLELAILLIVIFGVVVIELINTSLEELVNILSPEKRREAALAKNVAAAAVLLAAVGALLVGIIMFVPKL